MLKYLVGLLVVLLLLLQYRLWFEHNGLKETQALKSAITQQKQENAQLKSRNDALIAEVKSLKHAKNAIQERARNELGMIKKGEQFYLIVKTKNKALNP